MEHSEIKVQPIGVVRSPFKSQEGMPIQPGAAAGTRGEVILDPELAPGLKDLEGFSHLVLIYWFHQSHGAELLVKPFLDEELHGVFATRAPRRPNPIGLSVVKLIRIRGNILDIEDLDLLDGTPLLDIKPYVPEFDSPGPVRLGWLEKNREDIQGSVSDGRFLD